MTNEEYVFNQTSYERKRLGRGAFAKKNGSKSKKCTMPSDYLTSKQRKELNGAMISYNLERPMTWTEFKFLPVAVQCEYICNMRDKYVARQLDIAEMLGTSSKNLDAHMTRFGYKNKCMFGRSSKHTASPEWAAFLAEHSIAPAEEVEEQAIAEEPVKVVAPKEMYEATSGTLHYSGDPSIIFAKALNALDISKHYYITINFECKRADEDLTDF